jgi:hypothetical protein
LAGSQIAATINKLVASKQKETKIENEINSYRTNYE